MAQILDPLPNDENSRILCCYVNATSQIQIARITNIPNWYFERVVFPGQRLVFESEIEGILEIHSGMMASAILSDTIPCTKLALQAISPELNKKVRQQNSSKGNDSGSDKAAIASENEVSSAKVSNGAGEETSPALSVNVA